MATIIKTGCSAFYNRHWKGVFYPEKLAANKWFEYYCEHFDTIELNGTFYKFPTPESLQKLYARSPENFLFSVKAPKSITHLKKMSDCREQVEDFYAACAKGLGDKLACLLFQLPPSFQYSSENLEKVLRYLDPSFKNVVEFRHGSWWRSDVYEALAGRSLTFCSVSYPGLPDSVIANIPRIYLRLHGTPKLFYSNYDTQTLAHIRQALLQQDSAVEVFVYFNNTAAEAGVLNGLEFKRMNA